MSGSECRAGPTQTSLNTTPGPGTRDAPRESVDGCLLYVGRFFFNGVGLAARQYDRRASWLGRASKTAEAAHIRAGNLVGHASESSGCRGRTTGEGGVIGARGVNLFACQPETSRLPDELA